MAETPEIIQRSDSYLFELTQLLTELPFHISWILQESSTTYPPPFKKGLRLSFFTFTSAQVVLRKIHDQRIQEKIHEEAGTEVHAKLTLETMLLMLEILLGQLAPIQDHLSSFPPEVQESPEIAKLLQSFLRLQEHQNGISQALKEFLESEAPGFSPLNKEERVV